MVPAQLQHPLYLRILDNPARPEETIVVIQTMDQFNAMVHVQHQLLRIEHLVQYVLMRVMHAHLPQMPVVRQVLEPLIQLHVLAMRILQE
jgi:hypothetical protein